MTDVLQIAGALAVLVPFVLLQKRRLQPRSLAYLLPNLVGALVLAVLAALDRDWGFLLLEAVWAVTAASGTLAYLRDTARGGDPAA